MSIVQGLILTRSGTSVVVSIDGEELPPIPLARHLHGSTAAATGDACLVGVANGARTVVAVLGTAPAPPPPPPLLVLRPRAKKLTIIAQYLPNSGQSPFRCSQLSQ